MVPVHGVWVGTEPKHTAGKAGLLQQDGSAVLLNSFLLFALVAVSYRAANAP